MDDQLISKIYESVTDDSVWPDLMREMEGLVDGYSSALMIATPERNFMYQTNVNPEIVAAYNDHYHKHDVWFNRFDKIPVGSVVGGLSKLAPHSDFDQGYVNDILLASDCKDGLSAKLVGSSEFIASYSIYRDYSKDAFDNDAEKRMSSICTHLRNAIAMRSEFSVLAEQVSTLSAALSSMEEPMLVLRRDNTILWANTAAERELSSQILIKTRGGRLCLSNTRLERSLVDVIDIVFKNGVSLACPITETGHGTSGILYLTKIQGDFKHSLIDALTGSGVESLVVAKLKIGFQRNRHLQTILGPLFGLTDQQSAIAELVSDGLSVSEIAELKSITTGTVRDHIKAIFEKTGTHRQSELVRMLLQL